MLALFLALPSSAAEIQVVSNVPINVLVDGQTVKWTEGSSQLAVTDLLPGRHIVETRNFGGKTTAYKEIELGQHQRAKYEYRKKELWHIGTYDLRPPAAATTTQVVETTVVGAQTPGIGLVISDGYGTVSVGAGAIGGAAVTETTTTTTTVTTATGSSSPPAQGFAPIPAAPIYPMDPGSYAGLLGQLEGLDFSDEKHGVVQAAVVHNWFTCQQLAGIVDRFDFGDDKVKAVGTVRPRVVDPENAHMLNDRFDFGKDRQKAQAYFLR